MYQVNDTRYLTSLLQNTEGSKNSKLHYLDGVNRYLLAIYETWLKHPVTQLNSSQRASMDAGVKHLNVHIYLFTSVYQVLQST